MTTEYKYHHGYWDGAEREFRGFGMVEQSDTETFAVYNQSGLHGENADFEKFEDEKRQQFFSPPTLTKSWFHLGPVGEEFGEWSEIDYGDEFWSGDRPMLERGPEMQAFLRRLGEGSAD